VRRPVPVWGEPSLARYLGRLQREASDGFVEVIDHVLEGAPLTPVPPHRHGPILPARRLIIRRQAERNVARRAVRGAA
jgi:hypothetical protein